MVFENIVEKGGNADNHYFLQTPPPPKKKSFLPIQEKSFQISFV